MDNDDQTQPNKYEPMLPTWLAVIYAIAALAVMADIIWWRP